MIVTIVELKYTEWKKLTRIGQTTNDTITAGTLIVLTIITIESHYQ
jgi:hypothetical protein